MSELRGESELRTKPLVKISPPEEIDNETEKNQAGFSAC